MLPITPAEFQRRFRGTPLARAKRRGLLRNACIVLANLADPRALPALRAALAAENDPTVREEITAALQAIQAPPPEI